MQTGCNGIMIKAAAAAMYEAAVNTMGATSSDPLNIPEYSSATLSNGQADLAKSEQNRKASSSSSSSDEELQSRLKQVEMLERQVRLQKEREAVEQVEKLERKKQRRLRREQQMTDLKQKEQLLQQQVQQQQRTVPTKVSSTVPPPSSAGGNPAQKVLSDQVAEHEARRQQRAAAKKAKQKVESSRITIDEIRKIPDVQKQALDLMSQLQNMILSLASA